VERTSLYVECVCQNPSCGKIFFVRPLLIQRGSGKYCSSLCWSVAQRIRVQKECEYCGGMFEITPSRVLSGRGKYCSKSCLEKGRKSQSTLVKKTHPMIELACQECGASYKTRKDHWKNRKSNRPLLCPSCRERNDAPHAYIEEDRGYLTPCWVWMGTITESGYGRHRNKRVHKVFYEREKGPVPKGMELDHLCRVRNCVNPDHLEVVTHTENMRRSTGTKLDWDTVRFIRAQYEESDKKRGVFTRLGRQFGITTTQVCYIVYGKQWKNDPLVV